MKRCGNLKVYVLFMYHDRLHQQHAFALRFSSPNQDRPVCTCKPWGITQSWLFCHWPSSWHTEAVHKCQSTSYLLPLTKFMTHWGWAQMLKDIIPCSVGDIPSFLILQSPSDSSHCAGDYFPVISDIIIAILEKHFHKAPTLQFLAQLCKPKKERKRYYISMCAFLHPALTQTRDWPQSQGLFSGCSSQQAWASLHSV